MRVLGIGDGLDLGSMYLNLQRAGHNVRVFVGDAASRDTMAGLVETTPDWRAELAWVRAAGPDGFVLFETASHGALQDQLRGEGLQVIGGSALGDRLESDRGFGQQTMREAGMRVAPHFAFDDFAEAIAFVRRAPGRYVYKPSGSGFASGRTFVSQLADGMDLLAVLELQRRSWPAGEPVRLLLMQRLNGVEVGVGAYFNGRRFLQPACLDWEHKRFFPGDLGELTGEMGTLVTYRRSERLFTETLARLEDVLRAGRYRGYININTIVDEDGVHPLELTCRFGYPGFAILQALQLCGWEELFRRMSDEEHGAAQPFATRDGYAVGVVLTVPPFPYAAGYERLSKGLPIVFDPALTDDDRAHLHFAEVALNEGQLVTSGVVGYVMVVTGHGATVGEARADAYRRAEKVYLPNGRYRRDIGERFMATDEARLVAWGWLPP
ncbi:MAG TPA: phosphoribosylglycinamide synthetase C domain-containing protein [Polyangia bacterium]|nr:phosphoribosylglycinamide synthetase C domain-containing protein [Polyangia bacterium]